MQGKRGLGLGIEPQSPYLLKSTESQRQSSDGEGHSERQGDSFGPGHILGQLADAGSGCQALSKDVTEDDRCNRESTEPPYEGGYNRERARSHNDGSILSQPVELLHLPSPS